MGKVRTRILGLEDVEEKQKKKQKVKAEDKKSKKGPSEEPKAQEEAQASVPDKESSFTKVSTDAKAMVDGSVDKEKGAVVKKSAKKKILQNEGKARRRSQTYTLNKRLVDLAKKYKVEEAVVALKKMKPAKFDESVELHLNVDKAGLKGEVELPHATGKTVRVRVVDDATLAQIAAGKIEFDILVTHPSFMPKIAPLAKILGPRGLMPSPKSGTISDKPEELAKRFTSGALKWKTEAKASIIHQMVGKKSTSDKALSENVTAFIASVGQNHISSAYLTSTMSPSVPLEVEKN